MTFRKGDSVRMVDRYSERARCTCKKFEPSWFDGMRGTIAAIRPAVMVLLENERKPMRFDERDFVLDDGEHGTAGG